MRIQVGKKYRTRSGAVVRIAVEGDDRAYPFKGVQECGRTIRVLNWTRSGMYGADGSESKHDLVEELPEPVNSTGQTRLTLPTDSTERKNVPLYSGCLAYFPAALAGVAAHSKAGNEKHNPGQPLHHARGKSSDHMDCIARHQSDIGDLLALFSRATSLDAALQFDPRTLLAEANALCWRALALSQELHEQYGGAPLAPGAKLPE